MVECGGDAWTSPVPMWHTSSKKKKKKKVHCHATSRLLTPTVLMRSMTLFQQVSFTNVSELICNLDNENVEDALDNR